MNDVMKLISGLDVVLMIVVATLVKYFFTRLALSESELKKLKETSVTKQGLSELLDLKLAPHQTRLDGIAHTLDKISRTIPNI